MNIFLKILLTIILYWQTVEGQEFTNISQNEHEGKLSAVRYLNVGDRLPSTLLPNLINNKTKSLNTEVFKDRLLILDFWSISCKGCVMALPTLDSLQAIFGKKIKILPVTYEDEKTVKKFWQTNSFTKNVSLPSVVNDKILSGYFRHKTIPHEVWIYKGEIIAITTAQFVDSLHIEQVLKGTKIAWPIKEDFYNFDYDRALFLIDSNQVSKENTSIQYAALSDYLEGVNSESLSGGGSIIRDKKARTIRTFFLNQPAYTYYATLCLQAQRQEPLIKPTIILQPNQIIWEVKNKSKYQYISKEISGYEQEWVRKYAFCFEAVYPDTGQNDRVIYKQILTDLNQLLGLNVRWERKRENIFVLERDSSIKNIKILSDGDRAYTLAYLLNQKEDSPYVFTDDNVKKIYVSKSLKKIGDIKILNDSLLKYGLHLRMKLSDVDKLVFSEVDNLLPSATLIEEFNVLNSKSQRLGNPTELENSEFLLKNKDRGGVTILPSGLQYKIVKQGKGPLMKNEQKVEVNYTGMLVNGKIFESSLSTGFSQTIKISEIIEGWKEALKIMPSGSKWILYVPASLAYGTSTNQGSFPPNSTLIFEIELLQFI